LQPGNGEADFNVTLREMVILVLKAKSTNAGSKAGIYALIVVKVPIRLVIDDFIHHRKFVVNISVATQQKA
jgi:hypothetical protein